MYDVKAFAFFNSEAVEKAVDKTTRKTLTKIGAKTRRTQRAMIRRRKSTSNVGGAPSLRSRSLYHSPKNILFGYDARTQSVAIGMVRLDSTTVVGDTPLPEAFEKGRRITVRRPNGRLQVVNIRPRPSAVPAFEKEKEGGNIAKAWEGSVLP